LVKVGTSMVENVVKHVLFSWYGQQIHVLVVVLD
jgi:hypothetical protein